MWCEQGEPSGEFEFTVHTATHTELRQVRAGNAAVTAYVHNVDSLDIVPKVVYGFGDDAPSDKRLTKPNFIRYQKPRRAVFREEQSFECVIHCSSLERLQWLQSACGVRAFHLDALMLAARMTSFHRSKKSSGTMFFPCSVARISAIKLSKVCSRSGLRVAVRTRFSRMAF